jgi:hypothetical protein
MEHRPPTSADDLHVAYEANTRLDGHGADLEVVYPCPYCAAPDWLRVRVRNHLKALGSHAAHCACCGRTAAFSVNEDGGSVDVRLIQFAGPPPPPWFTGAMQ